jgi:hypothetical protein
MPPSWDQTAVPPLVGFTHFPSLDRVGVGLLDQRPNLREVLPRQSPSSSILASIS